ncbi:MAG: hypothetical protein NVS9B7_16980 [Flavisolibacter sp.]
MGDNLAQPLKYSPDRANSQDKNGYQDLEGKAAEDESVIDSFFIVRKEVSNQKYK